MPLYRLKEHTEGYGEGINMTREGMVIKESNWRFQHVNMFAISTTFYLSTTPLQSSPGRSL